MSPVLVIGLIVHPGTLSASNGGLIGKQVEIVSGMYEYVCVRVSGREWCGASFVQLYAWHINTFKYLPK